MTEHGSRLSGAPDIPFSILQPSTKQVLRIIQSIPSKKAEPFKMWLVQVGRERIEETIDPEITKDWSGMS